MQTNHYIVKNLDEFSKDISKVDNLRKYISNVESIFPYIEEVFGEEWKDGYIYVILGDYKDKGSYGRPSGVHEASIGFWDDSIQIKSYPENLWGCLLHETLHAFMNPIIYCKDGSTNDLDEYYWDNNGKEPFIFSFQALVYLWLEKKRIIDKTLCEKFLSKLDEEIFSVKPAFNLYRRYFNMFKMNDTNFSKFIKCLAESPTPLIQKYTFEEDLNKAEEASFK